jgi:hypothetical protein
MITQQEFVEGCQRYYAENYYEPGNPEDGEWHDCHYPAPKCLGGTETVKLLKEHHAVQGVLQSEEWQRCCIWGWEAEYLSGALLALCKKWHSSKGRSALTPEQRSVTGYKGHAALMAATTPEQRREIARRGNASLTPEQRRERAIRGRDGRTPEQRSDISRKGRATLTPEQKTEIGVRANAALTPEQRSERSRKARASMTPEQRSEIARKANASRSPEQRREAALKREATKRALREQGG